MSLLGYGADKQVTTTGVTVLPGAGTLYLNTPQNSAISGILSNRYYLNSVGDNQDSSGDNLDGPWYGMGYSGIPGLSGSPYVCLAGFYGVAMRSHSGFIQLAQNVNVGICTTNPTSLLHANGTDTWQTSGLAIRNSTVTNANFQFNVAGSSGWGTGGSFGIYNEIANSFSMVINPTGNVGIGTTNPRGTLHVNGNVISAYSSITLSTTLTNIHLIQDGSAGLIIIKGANFKYLGFFEWWGGVTSAAVLPISTQNVSVTLTVSINFVGGQPYVAATTSVTVGGVDVRVLLI
jgi:hypothetical protein